MKAPLSPKQWEFIFKSTAKWNFAHGSVRCGKTVCALFRFMNAVDECPDSAIWLVGHSTGTVYDNCVRLLFENPLFNLYKPFCTWSEKKGLTYKDKSIKVLGAKDEGAIGAFQGKTMSLILCDEMTLYPDSIIQMIDTRLSNPWSMGFATMNPSHPSHILKQWIDKAEAGDPNYYSLHFTLDDNPYLEDSYKNRIRDSLSGVFYKRNYLGIWCLAAGAIFDFFDRDVYVVKKPPRAAEYWIAGIDYGMSNAFACVLIGVSTGQYTQTGKCLWVEKEYYWDSHKTHKQKTVSEFAEDIQEFLEPYAVRGIYIDPSALAMKVEFQKKGMHIIDANNDVLNGIEYTTSEMRKGNLFVCAECKNLIREIEGYVWDEKKAKLGEDAPIKKADHCIDALRYSIFTHKVSVYNPHTHNPIEYTKNRFQSRF